MRKSLYVISLVTVGFLLGCDSSSKLASKVEGDWTTNTPQPIEVAGASEAVATYSYSFKRAQDTPGGEINVTAMVSVTKPVNVNTQTITEPIQVSASAIAKVKGTWRATDDDELFLMLDPESVTVEIDPSAVVLNYNNLTATSSPELETLNAGVAAQLKQEIAAALKNHAATTLKIEDVNIHDYNGPAPRLTWEEGPREIPVMLLRR